MTTKELLAAYQKGQRKFYDLDIDGDLERADLSGASFEECFFMIDFTGANLQNSSFKSGNIKTCDFTNANLRNAHFEDLAIESAEWKGANIEGITIKNLYSYSYTLQKKDFLELYEDMNN